MTTPLLDRIAAAGVTPVIAIESVDAALPLADALIAGGLPLAEVTFRTAAAADVIARLRDERPALLLGAGTVLTREQVDRALACGATFAFAPGLNPDTLRHAQDRGLFFIPGIATPSELEIALSLGCRVVKFFPSEANGGVPMLKALAGPYASTGVRIIPTGGVTLANLESYLREPLVLGVGGTWIAPAKALAAGDWPGIEENAREATEAVARIRGG